MSCSRCTYYLQRVLWLEIGNALAVGKYQNPSNQGFGKWCQAHGFVFSAKADNNNTLRSDAMWLAANWTAVLECVQNEHLANPHNIRAFMRALDYEAALPADLQDIHPEATVVLTEREGERIAKTILRSKFCYKNV